MQITRTSGQLGQHLAPDLVECACVTPRSPGRVGAAVRSSPRLSAAAQRGSARGEAALNHFRTPCGVSWGQAAMPASAPGTPQRRQPGRHA